MKGHCSHCNKDEVVHRNSFLRGLIPNCSTCGRKLKPTEEAMRAIRSRVLGALVSKEYDR